MESAEFTIELKKLGTRIRLIRKHRKLKLLDLEVITGINDSDISRIERGKDNIELHTICRIAKGLSVPLLTLFDYTGPLPDNAGFKTVPKSIRKKKTVIRKK